MSYIVILRNTIWTFVIIFSVAFIGCQKKGRKSPLSRSAYSGGQSQGTANITSSGQVGYFFVEDRSDDPYFFNGIYDVLSQVGTGQPEQDFGLSAVSGLLGADTGVRFSGLIELSGGVVNPTQMNNGQRQVMSQTSTMQIVIFDEATKSGNEAILLGAESVSGQVSQGRAVIEFKWAGQPVVFDGSFSGSYFEGVVKHKGTSFSYFSVATCDFFRCQ